jgi:chromosome segregation ATPase
VPREGLQHEAIENEREFYEMSSQQDIQKKKAAIQSKINERRIDEMQLTQENLREKFIDVNKFLKECRYKTKRAETGISDELEEQEMLKRQICDFEKDLGNLSAFEAKFAEIVEEFQVYEDVFNEVIVKTEFTSFDELVDRVNSLRKT